MSDALGSTGNHNAFFPRGLFIWEHAKVMTWDTHASPVTIEPPLLTLHWPAACWGLW